MAVLLAVALVVFPGVAPAQDEVRVIKVSAGHSPGDKDPIYHRRLLFFVFSHDLAPEHPWGGSMTTLKDGKVQKMIGTGLRGSVFHVEYTQGIVQSETLTFSYTNPTNRSKLRTTSGVDVESFTLDLSPPTAKRSRVRDSLLEIHFDKTVRGTPVPATATFSVTADGNEVDVSAVAIKGSVVTLTLAAAVNQGETVKVGYTMPADDLDYLMPVDKRLQGTVRTVVPSFTDLGVTNTSAGPTVTAAAMASTPSFDTDGDNTADTYGPGETIRVRLTFSEAVAVDTSGGVPSVKIRMDPDHDGVAATYESHTLTAVDFVHTVAEPDVSTAGIAVLEDTLALNGGTIRAAAGAKTHAWIRHDGIAHDTGHKVHWLEGVPRPTVDTVAIESTPSFDTDGDDTADTYGPG
ncbi:MAG: SwmB domain-containing protein, partial [Deltaproteobacteria bacterium]|nr:SwmB domain-containing protein [Deltaproteobacteria bacterium]